MKVLSELLQIFSEFRHFGSSLLIPLGKFCVLSIHKKFLHIMMTLHFTDYL